MPVIEAILLEKGGIIIADIATDILMDLYRKKENQVSIAPAEILAEAQMYQKMKEAGDKKIKDRIANRMKLGDG